MKLRTLTVRERLMLNNLIMVLVPIILLIILLSSIFYGLRSTGNFRERELELLWHEEGGMIPIDTGLSHLRAHAELGISNNLHRHCHSMEQLGIQVAAIDDGTVFYETVPSSAQDLLTKTYQVAPGTGSVMLWNDNQLIYRYVAKDRAAIAVAVGSVPITWRPGFFPRHIDSIALYFGWAVLLAMAFIIIITGFLLVRHLSQKILLPLEALRQAAQNIRQGNLDKATPIYAHDELGETATVFEQMRQQLHQDRDLRRQYEKNRQELLAGIAHDLATPLTKIQGYTSGILDGVANTPEKRQRYLQLVHKTSTQMDLLVRNLFVYSKLELGKVAFQWEQLTLVAYLKDYVDSQASTLADQGFLLQFLEPLSSQAASWQVRIDRGQFQRVLDNILSNSIKYQAGSTGQLIIKLSASPIDQFLRLEFIDNGVGVNRDELPLLFNSFYRTDKARSETAKGSGLGLAVTKKIIEEMDGKIWAEAALPQGLCIVIELPICNIT